MTYRIDRERVAHETLEGEVVILDQVSGNYFSLTGAGADAWELIGRGADDAGIAAGLVGRFEVDVGVAAAAVAGLVAELLREELIAVGDGGAGVSVELGLGGPRDAAKRAWVAPKLERFTDLQSLLVLDPIHDVDLDGAGWPRQQVDKPTT